MCVCKGGKGEGNKGKVPHLFPRRIKEELELDNILVLQLPHDL